MRPATGDSTIEATLKRLPEAKKDYTPNLSYEYTNGTQLRYANTVKGLDITLNTMTLWKKQ